MPAHHQPLDSRVAVVARLEAVAAVAALPAGVVVAVEVAEDHQLAELEG